MHHQGTDSGSADSRGPTLRPSGSKTSHRPRSPLGPSPLRGSSGSNAAAADTRAESTKSDSKAAPVQLAAESDVHSKSTHSLSPPNPTTTTSTSYSFASRFLPPSASPPRLSYDSRRPHTVNTNPPYLPPLVPLQTKRFASFSGSATSPYPNEPAETTTTPTRRHHLHRSSFMPSISSTVESPGVTGTGSGFHLPKLPKFLPQSPTRSRKETTGRDRAKSVGESTMMTTTTTGASSSSSSYGVGMKNARLRAKSRAGTTASQDLQYFVYKRAAAAGKGQRHHAFPVGECPYPVACDRETLDLDVQDQEFLFQDRNSNSFVDWRNRPTPKRVLDLGCGNGSWILAMAPDWQYTRFVGFDVVPVHVDLKHLNNDTLERRVEWVYRNFLTKPLPFPDASFDFVHVKSIGKGVPEDKWDFVFEQVARVLRPGGAVEVLEEDIIFPFVKPAIPLKKREPTRDLIPAPLPSPYASHSRSHTKTPPRQTVTPPASDTESPSRPHGRGHPPQLLSQHSTLSFSSLEDVSTWSRRSNQSAPSTPWSSLNRLVRDASPPPPVPPLPPPKDDPPLSPVYKTFMDTKLLPQTPPVVQVADAQRRTRGADDDGAGSVVFGDLETLFERVFERRFINMQPTSLLPNLLNIHFVRTVASAPIEVYLTPPRDEHSHGAHKRTGSLVGTLSPKLVEEGIALQLHRVLAGIFACKESMWEELLFTRGWTTVAAAEANASQMKAERAKFDALMERYRTETQERCSLRDATEKGLGWKAPKKDPRTKTESAEEAEAGENDEDECGGEMPFRRVRMFVAFKAG